MAAWRLYLTDQTVRRLDILPGKPPVLAAWTGLRRVSFFDLSHGNPLGEQVFDHSLPEQRAGDAWEAFLSSFNAPNGSPLPQVRVNGLTIHSASDGMTRVLHDDHSGDLFFDSAGQQVRLHREAGTRFVAVATNRTSGMTAALDEAGRLHTYKRDVRLAIADLALAVEDWRPALALPSVGNRVICSNGDTVIVTDASGKIEQQLRLHYRLGPVACSPDGKYVALGDVDVGVIRVYNAELQPTHQRFAADLLADARRVQLLGGNTSGSGSMLSALALNNRGVLAFALGGMVCVSNVSRLSAIPRD